MMPKENKVSLVVESNYSSSSELRLLGKQRSHQSADSNSDFGVKIVQNQFRDMVSCKTMPFDIFLKLNTGDLENGQYSFQMSDEELPPMSESNYNNMCVVKISGIFIHFFKSHFVPGVEINVMKDHHELLDHIIYFCGRFDLRGDENFNRDRIIQNGVKLIKLLFVVLIRNLLIGNLLIFDCLRHLPLLSGQFLSLFSLLHFQLVLLNFTLGMNLYTLHFIFDIMGFHFDALVELRDRLWLVDYSPRLVFGFIRVGLLHVMLFLAFFTHC